MSKFPIYHYHPATNSVTKYKDYVTYDQWSNEPREDNLFWVASNPESGRMEIVSDNLEMLNLLTDKQTEEQAVILFATMLGLREQAAE